MSNIPCGPQGPIDPDDGSITLAFLTTTVSAAGEFFRRKANSLKNTNPAILLGAALALAIIAY